MKPKEKMPGEVVEARNSRKRKSWSRSVLLYVTKDKAFVDNEVRSLSELALLGPERHIAYVTGPSICNERLFTLIPIAKLLFNVLTIPTTRLGARLGNSQIYKFGLSCLDKPKISSEQS